MSKAHLVSIPNPAPDSSLLNSMKARFEKVPPNKRLLISVAGIPGSGKTTLVSRVVHGINKKLGKEVAAMVPMVRTPSPE